MTQIRTDGLIDISHFAAGIYELVVEVDEFEDHSVRRNAGVRACQPAIELPTEKLASKHLTSLLAALRVMGVAYTVTASGNKRTLRIPLPTKETA